MKIYKSIAILILMLLALVACSGGQQESGSQGEQPAANSEATLAGGIPLYPDAKSYETGSNMVVDAIVNPMMQQFESQYGANTQVKFFAVPQGTTAKDIEGFYGEKMTGMGWKAETVQNPNPSATTLVWTKEDKNVFVLSFMEIPQMEPMLMTVVAEQS